MTDATKYYELIHPGLNFRGIVTEKPQIREQEKFAASLEGYVVVFFPKITGIGDATIYHHSFGNTFSQTPEAAISKFIDEIPKKEKWETYHDAGHRVRKVKITDLGDA